MKKLIIVMVAYISAISGCCAANRPMKTDNIAICISYGVCSSISISHDVLIVAERSIMKRGGYGTDSKCPDDEVAASLAESGWKFGIRSVTVLLRYQGSIDKTKAAGSILAKETGGVIRQQELWIVGYRKSIDATRRKIRLLRREFPTSNEGKRIKLYFDDERRFGDLIEDVHRGDCAAGIVVLHFDSATAEEIQKKVKSLSGDPRVVEAMPGSSIISY